ncbi:GntR family transcriptional regulator [Ramlibacter sp. MAHUQ-53]|uniref:GntR family transcriptional regulator n=1 Tax=unclassified Ramlibacter TaxID=2617605 RepID=UPI00363A31F8
MITGINAPTPQAPAGQSRYGWLAAALRARIVQGEWAPGEAIPPEAALAPAYGVALGTIRQAIALLVADGLLERRQGRGTFVKAGLGGASMMRFFRFRHGGELQATPRSRILSARTRLADAQEAGPLGLPEGAGVLALERLRSIVDRPCLLESITLPLPLFQPLADSDPHAWGDLLYPLYQRACGVTIHHAEDHLAFDRLSAGQARHLQLEKGHPCARVQRRAFDLAGRCVELRTTRGDAFAFEYTAQVR